MKSNRLAHEKSPYLLQHAHNPVDWYPWGEEAFAKARKESKPIFLSIGYATCHWCHVMEKESFENEEVARYLNEHFVSIKVDREERPDIDAVYMKVVQAMTGSGGWPLSAFLTPEKKPFYGGTYFPPEDRWGRTGFLTVLKALSQAWVRDRAAMETTAHDVVKTIAEHLQQRQNGEAFWEESVFDKVFHTLRAGYDTANGGFGGAPKFPQHSLLYLLLALYRRSQNPEVLAMLTGTLDHMIDGGIYDHVGFGLHRYATDERWHVPHFEKMLYDQALLLPVLIEAFQTTNKQCYRRVAEEILAYVLRDMRHPDGAFYSAEDADSVKNATTGEKSEGFFYIWTYDDVVNALSKDESQLWLDAYDVQAKGNVVADPHQEFEGYNIFQRVMDDTALAQKYKMSETDVSNILVAARQKLLVVRAKRIRPGLDDKILLDWNGLMISALAQAARVLNRPDYAQEANKVVQFIEKNMVAQDQDKHQRLYHRYREGHRAVVGMLDDYAFYTHSLLELYAATEKKEFLQKALTYAEQMLTHFSRPGQRGLFTTAQDAEALVWDECSATDSAIPSGNALAVLVCIRLAKATGNLQWQDRAERLLQAFASEAMASPLSCSYLVAVAEEVFGGCHDSTCGLPKADLAE